MYQSVGLLANCYRFEIGSGYDLEEITQGSNVELRIRDQAGKFVFQNLPDQTPSSSVCAAISDAVASISLLVMTQTNLSENIRLRDFFALTYTARAFLLSFFIDRYSVEIIDLVEHGKDSCWSLREDSADFTVERDSLMRAIHLHEDQRFCKALANGVLEWPSIFGGVDVEARLLFASFDMGIVIAHDRGVKYYVGLGLADMKAFCVFIPAAGLCFGWNSSWHSLCFAKMTSDPMWLRDTLRKLLLLSSGDILQWLSEKVLTNGQIMWPANDAHLGHYIWNELTGLEKIVASADASRIEIWQLSNKDATNFYGPLAWIFPEFHGRIRKDIDSFADLNAFLITTQTQAVRVSGMVVSESVRLRVKKSIETSANAPCLRAMSDQLFEGRTVILLGLREGKRVLQNTVEFYIYIIAEMQRKAGKLAILIDGLNAAPGVENLPFKIHHGSTKENPFDAERHIATQIISFCESIAVPCFSMIGSAMDFNLSMIMRAHVFVAPWGGGLAKYRWVANLPGYVVASAHNLSRPYILSIYHADMFMEKGAPLVYADAAGIEDVEVCQSAGQSDVDYRVTRPVMDHAVETLSMMLQKT